MKTVLVTGSAGFIGRNLIAALRRRDGISLRTFDVGNERSVLDSALYEATIVYHLAGVNRPESEDEFATGNEGLTRDIIEFLEKTDRKPLILFSSSIQAEHDNPYGRSKNAAEEILLDFSKRANAQVCIYRLPNVFGKWSRPNYNTVVATFCHNIARGIDINISEPDREMELVYIDDVVEEFLSHLDIKPDPIQNRFTISRTFRTTLRELADRIHTLRDIRETLVVPDLSDDFMKCLHATYLSFMPESSLSCPVRLNRDYRGWLFELIKSDHFGQIFVSKTLPGITRGNHYHDSKLEKFCVIQGQGIVRMRKIDSDEVLEYPINGTKIKVVDIPPGHTHSIENTGEDEMICLFWSNQIYNPQNPDTFLCEVVQ